MMTQSKPAYHIGDTFGSCVIFNIENVQNRESRKRNGTNDDKSLIMKTFKDIGYSVYAEQDPTAKTIETKMKHYVDTVDPESSSFICFILSHGTKKNEIITNDDVEMDLNDIIKLSDHPALEGKPKIFVVQACRGKGQDPGVDSADDNNVVASPADNAEIIPLERNHDLLFIFASPPGYKSYRSSKGTPFIKMLCHVLTHHRKEAPVSVLMQRVILTISCMPFWFQEEQRWFLQVPYITSTLRKSLRLQTSTSSNEENKRKINTIQYSRAETARRRIVRLLQEVRGFDTEGQFEYTSDKSIYHKFLLEQTSGCYDMSTSKERHCLVINTTTGGAFKKAEQDYNDIKKTMESMKFNVQNTKDMASWRNKIKGIVDEGKPVGCIFCFIQIDDKNDTSNSALLTEIISAVKNEKCMLDKPKIYIIQPYCYHEKTYTDGPNECPGSNCTHPVRYSKESDVLIVQVLPVELDNSELSFINLFCQSYSDDAKTISIMDYIECILPGKYQARWIKLQPSVCSTMRKDLVIADSFEAALYKSDIKKEEKLCIELDQIINELEKRIHESPLGNNVARTEYDSDLNSIEQLERKSGLDCNTERRKTSVFLVGMIVAAVVLVIPNFIRVIYVVVGNLNNQDCNDDKNDSNNNTSWLCEHSSRRLTILIYDVTSCISNILILIACIVIVKTRIINSLRKRPFLNHVIEAMFFAVYCVSLIIETIGFAKRLEYGFKDQATLSGCVSALIIYVIIVMAVRYARIYLKKEKALSK